jgi:hypothetical protein
MSLPLNCGDSCGVSLATRSRTEPEILCHSFPSSELILVNVRTLQYHDEVAARTEFFFQGGDGAFELSLTKSRPVP